MGQESLLIFHILTHTMVKSDSISESKYVKLICRVTACIIVDYLFSIKQKKSWYFQRKVDYYFKKTNKKKKKNFQFIASTKTT